MTSRLLVLGGIRSGKSRWAEGRFGAPGPAVRYLATGTGGDDADWAARVDAHRARRPAHWSTVESTDVAAVLGRPPHPPTLVDDLGGWLTALLDRHGWDPAARLGADVDALCGAVRAFPADLVLVSPEVGLSVVAGTTSGRRFADELGALNQRLAAECDRVVLVVAGQPLEVKPGGGGR